MNTLMCLYSIILRSTLAGHTIVHLLARVQNINSHVWSVICMCITEWYSQSWWSYFKACLNFISNCYTLNCDLFIWRMFDIIDNLEFNQSETKHCNGWHETYVCNNMVHKSYYLLLARKILSSSKTTCREREERGGEGNISLADLLERTSHRVLVSLKNPECDSVVRVSCSDMSWKCTRRLKARTSTAW